MRKIANLPAGGKYVRAMIYDSTEGVYLFLYDTHEDAPGVSDESYETVADAEAACEQRFEIAAADWKIIEAPLAGCQHDWISPTRIKVGSRGEKLWGQFKKVGET